MRNSPTWPDGRDFRQFEMHCCQEQCRHIRAMPQITFTSPEVAQIGLTEKAALKRV